MADMSGLVAVMDEQMWTPEEQKDLLSTLAQISGICDGEIPSTRRLGNFAATNSRKDHFDRVT